MLNHAQITVFGKPQVRKSRGFRADLNHVPNHAGHDLGKTAGQKITFQITHIHAPVNHESHCPFKGQGFGHRDRTQPQKEDTMGDGGKSPVALPIETRYRGCRFRSRLEARWGCCSAAHGFAIFNPHESSRAQSAYSAARAARFEHGERP